MWENFEGLFGAVNLLDFHMLIIWEILDYELLAVNGLCVQSQMSDAGHGELFSGLRNFYHHFLNDLLKRSSWMIAVTFGNSSCIITFGT